MKKQKKTVVVYKLTREDGQEYIGTAINFRTRLCNHKKSERFSEKKIIEIEFLGEFVEYEDALRFEMECITKYDTFHNGLNKTLDGTGNHQVPHFSTKGYKFSEKSKKLMGQRSKERGAGHRLQAWRNNLSHEDKLAFNKKISDGKTNKAATSIFSKEIIREIMTLYASKPLLENVGKVSANGKILTYVAAFAKKYAPEYGMVRTGMKNILTGKGLCHRDLYNEILGDQK
jgi:predicted GIY-YIG superfamily endonuclease